MTFRRKHLFPLLAIAAFLGSASSWAQEPEAQIRVDVELVNLFVTVRDGRGQPVNDLTKNDFRIREDGRAQRIEYFARDTSLPLTLGLLLDTSGSQRNLLYAEQAAATQFLERTLREGDEAMVVTFDVNVALPDGFTSDRAALERAIHRARINMPDTSRGDGERSPGGTTLYDAIYRACRERLAQRAGRKALVIITDAEDTGSRATLEEALDAAQRTDTILHIILITQRSGFGFGKQNERVARKLAEQTGGRVIEAAYAPEIDAAFQQIAEELRSQYILGYTSTNRARDGKWRKLRVETERRGLRVLTRPGYFAAVRQERTHANRSVSVAGR
ncbi:MAG: VWA domain-containing protein [Candidatus Acidiferrales bacterium]